LGAYIDTYIPVSQPPVHGGNPNFFFFNPRNPYTWKYQQARKQRGSLYSKDIIPVLPITGQKFPKHFTGDLEISLYFKMFLYLFIY